jgi:hypothetical protein
VTGRILGAKGMMPKGEEHALLFTGCKTGITPLLINEVAVDVQHSWDTAHLIAAVRHQH